MQSASASPAAVTDARAAWQLVSRSGRTAADPIAAFRLSADVLTRDGVQTNETQVDYRYLAPDCIRFVLPSQRETGRFGPKQRDYWLKDKEEVVTLAGRDYAEDRRLVDEMIAVARNFVALSDPSRIELSDLTLLSAPPPELYPALAREASKWSWLRLVSPDFALVPSGANGTAPASYAVELAFTPRRRSPPGGHHPRAPCRGASRRPSPC